MRRIALLIAACVVLLAAGVAHGLRTDRWGDTADLASAASRFDAVPSRVGDWEATNGTISQAEVKAAHIAGYAIRRFTHRYTRAEITVLVLVGRPGPVAVHTPDVCFAGAGFKSGPAEVRALPDGGHAWTAEFTKPGPTPESLRVSWTWSDGGEWLAPSSPRTEFARVGALYKLYVVRPLGVRSSPEDEAAEVEFLKQFLPELRAKLLVKGD